MPTIESLEKLLAAGKDSALLRFSLGGEYLRIGDHQAAIENLQASVAMDPAYSAAWKVLGNAHAAAGAAAEAMLAYSKGIAAAEARGDKQAAKEMTVFKRRLERLAGDA